MTTEPNWLGGDVALAELPRRDGRTDMAATHAVLVWASTGQPLTHDELDQLRAAGEADPAAVERFILDPPRAKGRA